MEGYLSSCTLKKGKSRKMWGKDQVGRREKQFIWFIKKGEDEGSIAYWNIVRVNDTQFDALFQMIDEIIKKQDMKQNGNPICY